jgi:hypothetical protein
MALLTLDLQKKYSHQGSFLGRDPPTQHQKDVLHAGLHASHIVRGQDLYRTHEFRGDLAPAAWQGLRHVWSTPQTLGPSTHASRCVTGMTKTKSARILTPRGMSFLNQWKTDDR